jgi:large subunit ribosomal protein L19
MNIIETLEKEQLRKDIPEFRPGDTVKLSVRVVEGTRERVQAYEGVVISRSGSGVKEMFTVRRISYGVGVERTFPVHSPDWQRLKCSARAMFVVPNCITCSDLTGKAARITERK